MADLVSIQMMYQDISDQPIKLQIPVTYTVKKQYWYDSYVL